VKHLIDTISFRRGLAIDAEHSLRASAAHSISALRARFGAARAVAAYHPGGSRGLFDGAKKST
jgi:hypothetical protein